MSDREGMEYQSGDPLYYKFLEEERVLHEQKNQDYRSDADPLANFERVSAIEKLYPEMDWSSREGICITYALKQMDACISLLEKGKEGVVENVDTRARDVSVYWRLLRVLHRR
jgi:hypothetical protein